MMFKKLDKDALNAQLIDAAEAGEIGKVEKLLRKGADVNAKNEYGWTVLMRAIYRGHRDIVKVLIEKGADVSLQNIDGSTAAMLARENGHKEVAEYIESYSIKQNIIDIKAPPEDVVPPEDAVKLKNEIEDMLRKD